MLSLLQGVLYCVMAQGLGWAYVRLAPLAFGGGSVFAGLAVAAGVGAGGLLVLCWTDLRRALTPAALLWAAVAAATGGIAARLLTLGGVATAGGDGLAWVATVSVPVLAFLLFGAVRLEAFDRLRGGAVVGATVAAVWLVAEAESLSSLGARDVSGILTLLGAGAAAALALAASRRLVAVTGPRTGAFLIATATATGAAWLAPEALGPAVAAATSSAGAFGAALLCGLGGIALAQLSLLAALQRLSAGAVAASWLLPALIGVGLSAYGGETPSPVTLGAVAVVLVGVGVSVWRGQAAG